LTGIGEDEISFRAGSDQLAVRPAGADSHPEPSLAVQEGRREKEKV